MFLGPGGFRHLRQRMERRSPRPGERETGDRPIVALGERRRDRVRFAYPRDQDARARQAEGTLACAVHQERPARPGRQPGWTQAIAAHHARAPVAVFVAQKQDAPIASLQRVGRCLDRRVASGQRSRRRQVRLPLGRASEQPRAVLKARRNSFPARATSCSRWRPASSQAMASLRSDARTVCKHRQAAPHRHMD